MHVALEVEEATLTAMFARGKSAGVETRGIVDHGMLRSVYFRDPNGYVVELAANLPGHEAIREQSSREARRTLDAWQTSRSRRG